MEQKREEAKAMFVQRRYSWLRKTLKRAERLLKDGALAVLMRLCAPHTVSQPGWDGRRLRVLFLRHDKIGDMILSTGIIHAIATSRPNIELDVLASSANAAVLEQDPLVHRVVKFDVHRLCQIPGLVRHFRRVKYDVVVDCMVFSQSLTTLLLMLATRAPHRVGVRKADRPNIYTLPCEPAGPNAHHVEHLARLAPPFGVAAKDALRLEIALTDGELAAALNHWNADKRVLVNISVGKAFRQWDDANFIAVARHLKASCPDARVLILHAPAERDRAQGIADAAGVARALTPGVREALAMVATAHLVFTPDTSVVHAASAFHVPTVAMVTADHAVRWGLYQTTGEVVVSSADTLDVVPLDEALAAVDRILPATSQLVSRIGSVPPEGSTGAGRALTSAAVPVGRSALAR